MSDKRRGSNKRGRPLPPNKPESTSAAGTREKYLNRFILKITPIEARGLMRREGGRFPSPYCTLVLLDAKGEEIEEEKQKTCIQNGSCNPTWSPVKKQQLRDKERGLGSGSLGLGAAAATEEFSFGTKGDLGRARTLLIKCKSESLRKVGEDLGRIYINLLKVPVEEEKVEWFKLQPTSRKEQVKGELRVATRLLRRPSKRILWGVANQMMNEMGVGKGTKHISTRQMVEWLIRHGPSRPTSEGLAFSSIDDANIFVEEMLRQGIVATVTTTIFRYNVRTYARFATQHPDKELAKRATEEMNRVLSESYVDPDEQEIRREAELIRQEDARGSASPPAGKDALRKGPKRSFRIDFEVVSSRNDQDWAAAAGLENAIEEEEELGEGRERGCKQLIIKDFVLLKLLAQLPYSRLFLVRLRADDKLFAIKAISKIGMSQSVREIIKEQRDRLYQVDHPFVGKLQFAFQNEDKLYFGLEWYPGGTLDYHLKQSQEGSLPEPQAKFYLAELVLAVEYLHEEGIVCGDIRAEHVMIDKEGHIHLVDAFGSLGGDPLEEAEETMVSSQAVDYIAPELLKRSSNNARPKLEPSCDWWSLGILFCKMLTGRTPFADANVSVALHNLQYGEVLIPAHIQGGAREVLLGLLNRAPNARMSGKDLRAHPFFESVDWDMLKRKDAAPPWRPDLLMEEDVRYYDEDITCQEPVDTPEWRMLDTYDARQEHLQGFTFVPEAIGEQVEES